MQQLLLDKTPATFDVLANIQIDKSQVLFNKLKSKEWGIVKNSIGFYILGWLLMGVYLGKACPIVDKDFIFASFNNLLYQVGAGAFISLVPLYILRCILMNVIGRETILQWSNVKYVLFESMIFFIWTIFMFSVGIYIDLIFESLMKITILPFVVSVFSVFNMYLHRQSYLYIRSKENKELSKAKLNNMSFVSLQTKFIIASVVIFLIVGLVIAAVSLKNFWWLIHSYEAIVDDLEAGVASVFKEVVFVIAIFTGFMIITSVSYTTNIKLVFVLLNNTVYNIFSGKFDNNSIPTINDEFGVMGENMVKMSHEIAEKKKVEQAFGKVVSPKVAEIILNSGVEKKGSLREIVVLFSDIRGFTNTTHNTDPVELVDSLNEYFTDMVGVIEEQEGLVDKFIGDALMVLFGYDDLNKGINNAVLAAYNMQKKLSETKSKFKTGIGIAVGKAVVGLMGSPDRLDFTAIGDTVNKAARLESATSKEKLDIIIDADVYNSIHSNLQALPWIPLKVTAKGFDKKIKVFGLDFKSVVNRHKKQMAIG